MNFLCHALPYLDQPLLAVSTGIPDWMSVVDRKVRARGKLAALHVNSHDPELAAVAAGILRHIQDDRWFHGTEAFVQTNFQLAVQLRDQLPGDTGFRPMFVGHILIEMLLDSFWIRDDAEVGERYYDAVASIDPLALQRCVVEITGRQVVDLSPLIGRFCEVKFLYDYLEPDKLLMRINQVMKRVGLSELPTSLAQWLPTAGKLVESRRVRMLTPPDGSDPFGFSK